MAAPHADLAHLDYAPEAVDRIMRKRQEDLERRARFFDAKSRNMGLDMRTLGRQAEEKAAMRQAQADDDQAHAQAALLYDQAAVAVEQARIEDDRQSRLDLLEYNQKHVRMDMRREYALSDPVALKRELPARVGEHDPRCGPSSMQKFDGELLEKDKTVNKKLYQLQQRQWLLDQMAEKEAKRQAERAEQAQDDQQVLMATEVRGLIEGQASSASRSAMKAHADYNKQLGAMQQQQRQSHRAREEDTTKAHVTKLATSDRYREFHDAPQGQDARVLRDEYKRISKDGEQAIYDANALQIIEKRQREKAEREEEAQEADRTLRATMVMTAVEQEQKRLELERNHQMRAENAVIAQAQRSMKTRQNGVYANTVTDEFFGNFNAGGR